MEEAKAQIDQIKRRFLIFLGEKVNKKIGLLTLLSLISISLIYILLVKSEENSQGIAKLNSSELVENGKNIEELTKAKEHVEENEQSESCFELRKKYLNSNGATQLKATLTKAALEEFSQSNDLRSIDATLKKIGYLHDLASQITVADSDYKKELDQLNYGEYKTPKYKGEWSHRIHRNIISSLKDKYLNNQSVNINRLLVDDIAEMLKSKAFSNGHIIDALNYVENINAVIGSKDPRYESVSLMSLAIQEDNEKLVEAILYRGYSWDAFPYGESPLEQLFLKSNIEKYSMVISELRNSNVPVRFKFENNQLYGWKFYNIPYSSSDELYSNLIHNSERYDIDIITPEKYMQEIILNANDSSSVFATFNNFEDEELSNLLKKCQS